MLKKIIDYIYYRSSKKVEKQISHIGKSVQIKHPITIANPSKLIIEDYVHIGGDAWISCYTKVQIKRGAIISPRIKIYTGNHNYESNFSIPYDNITIAKSVIIDENVWIGGDVIIMPGVNLGEGCIVAGGSVVTKSFPKYSLIGGNPAKLIKMRNVEIYNKLKSEDRIYLKLKEEGCFNLIIKEE